MGLELIEGIEFLNVAMEKQREEEIRQMWVVQLPFMNRETYISFSDYFDKITGRNVIKAPTSDILEEIKRVEAKFQRGGDNSGS